jgi:RNA polymerase sigma-70 factor (TIGR02943 family)
MFRPALANKDLTMTQRYPTGEQPASQELPEPGQWVERYGDMLYRYALARLRRPQDAEEAVQDTLLAALQARGQFQGRSQPRTWFIGILKCKIVDRFRAAAHQASATEVDDLDAWFDGWGHWRKSPRRCWDDPAASAERSDFWEVVHRCLGKLSARMATVFILRTIDDCAPATVCRDLKISSANLWVLLHRARLQMMRCLEINWFDTEVRP